ncbi:MAG: aminodeoxychorismate synthase component I [Deltaproteobacteria bacterium]|nr:aminodeoxychorismate synthase component I [Deltaproteobacteria bacterium]
MTGAVAWAISSPMDSRDISSAPVRRFLPFSGERGAILLESQRPDVRDRYSYLLRNPVSLLSTSSAVEAPRILEEASARQTGGFAVAGYVSYEAGFALDAAFSPTGAPAGDFPLAWFGIYAGVLRFDHLLRRWESSGSVDWPEEERGDPLLPYGDPIDPRFSFTETEYGVKVEEIRRAIAAGRYYQANLTGKFSFSFPGDPFSLYARLRAIQPVKYGAFLRTDAGCILSQSPELFFRIRGKNIEVQPMKGTAARGRTEVEDRRAAAALKADPKNRAENVMIVDLMRNDLGKVCEVGSVHAPRLFEVHRLRTVLQMVSTVSGTLRPGATVGSLFHALFPCGSVTGAPKISAMRALRRLETSPRGVYTGAIGILLPGGDMTFSVAIRTVTLRNGLAEAGAGGGIVWDSDPREEFREVCLKGRYLSEPPVSFQLIETFLWSAGTGFRFLPAHLRRLASSARYFGFRFREEAVRPALRSALRKKAAASPQKVRLLLSRNGEVSVEMSPLTTILKETRPARVTISAVGVSSRDPFVRHKTTHRGWRDEELRKARNDGFDEVIFLNERGEVAEGAITNLFVEADGRLLTPPASCGLLEGIRRRRILADRSLRAEERVLYPEDLRRRRRILLTNSVRGIVPAMLCISPAGRPGPRA